MKKLLAISLLTICVSCTSTTTIPAVVTSVEYLGGSSSKYKIVLNGTTTLYSDSLYTVGDIIK